MTDGERVYAYFGMHGLYAYDFAGKQVWKLDLGSYPMAMGFGTGSSPALARRQGVRPVRQRAANRSSSPWTPRPARSCGGRSARSATGYSSPLVWKNKERTEIVCVGSRKVRSYDPATGKQLWELGGMAGQPKATPVATDELLIVGTGGGPGGMMGGGGFGPPGGPKGGPGGGPKGGFGMGGGNSRSSR